MSQNAIQKSLQIPAHDSLAQCERHVIALVETGRRTALQIAILIAEARNAYFGADYKGWIQWCADRFGYKPRMAVTCLNAGDLLQRYLLQHAALKSVDVTSLETIHQLEKHGLVSSWLSANDPAHMTRDEIRDSVRRTRMIACGMDPEEAPEPEPPVVTEISADDESSAQFMSRLERLKAFDPARIDLLKQIDYVEVYGYRLQEALKAQARMLDADTLHQTAETCRCLAQNFAELVATLESEEE